MRWAVAVLALAGAMIYPAIDASDVAAQSGNKGSWTTKAPMPTARQGAAGAVADDKIYVIGGWKLGAGILSTNQRYDPATDTWSTMAPMPTARSEPMVAVVGGKIYVIGGHRDHNPHENNYAPSSSSGRVEVYDPATDTWSGFSQQTAMPTNRGSGTAFAVGSKIHVVGGWCRGPSGWCSGGGGIAIYDKVEIYDTAIDSWTQGAPAPTPIAHADAVELQGQIYIMGGTKQSTSSLENYEDYYTHDWQNRRSLRTFVFDPSTGQWDQVSDFGEARAGYGAAAYQGYYMIVGGFDGSSARATIVGYRPATDTYHTGTLMPTPRVFLTVAAVGDYLYAIGGSDRNTGSIYTKNERFHVVASEPPPPSPPPSSAPATSPTTKGEETTTSPTTTTSKQPSGPTSQSPVPTPASSPPDLVVETRPTTMPTTDAQTYSPPEQANRISENVSGIGIATGLIAIALAGLSRRR